MFHTNHFNKILVKMTNQKVQTALDIFFLDGIQAKIKVRMFDVSNL